MLEIQAGKLPAWQTTRKSAWVKGRMETHLGPPPLLYKRMRFVAHLPSHFLYTPSHFWLEAEGENRWRIGLTKFASRMLGEMVDYGFDAALEAPVNSGQVIGWIEGFKAVSDLFCVAEGRFAGGNPALQDNITLVNKDPHGSGWLYAVVGKPWNQAVDVRGYAAILDQTIDRLASKPEVAPPSPA